MWGLIYKDIIVNKKTLLLSAIGTVVLFALFSVTIFVMEDGNDVTESVSSIIALMITVCSFACWIDIPSTLIKGDEKGHWSAFVSSSESNVQGQLQSKYVLPFIILVLVVNFLYFALMIDDMILYSATGYSGMSSTIGIAVFFASVLMLLWAVEIPFAIYFGSKTGGIVKLIVVFTITLGFLINGLYGKETLSFDKLYDLLFAEKTDAVTLFVLSAIQIGAAVLYYLSYRLSCKLYLKGAENFE